MTSHSLAQVLELTASYGKVISTTMDMSLAHNASSSSLSLRTLHGNEAKQAALLCVIAFIQRQANSLSQHRVTPVEDYFGCSVDTESPQGWFIRYSYHDVMEPYAAQNAMLREANEQIVRQYLNRVRQYSFTVRVEEEIEELYAILKEAEGT